MRTSEFREDWFNPDATLPYGVKPGEIRSAIREFYEFYNDLNGFLMREHHGRIETVLRANNALSDFIGNVATEELAQASDALKINQKQDGFPDILPVGNEEYNQKDYEVHHGEEGIETKCSKSQGGWQAHNNEEGWFVVFRYKRGDPEDDLQDMDPIRLVQVLAASLTGTTGRTQAEVKIRAGRLHRPSSRAECTNSGLIRFMRTQTLLLVGVKN